MSGRVRRMTDADYRELGIDPPRGSYEEMAMPLPFGCTLGVGCDDAGVCFAAAHGQPGRCPLHDADRCEICGDETGACACD